MKQAYDWREHKEWVETSNAVHSWLRDALRTALTKDPVDALNDAEQLVMILKGRWDEMSRAYTDEALGLNR